jgi:hypothetical protein
MVQKNGQLIYNIMQYFIKDLEKELILISEYSIKTYGYFLAGFQDENDKGKLTVIQNINGSTCLVPVYNLKGKQIKQPEKAGKYLKEIN